LEKRISAEKAPVKIDPTVITDDLKIQSVTLRKGKPVGLIRVAVEETLSHYAEWLAVSPGVIRRVNGFGNRKMLRIDQKMKIPLHKISKEAFEEKRLEYHIELVEDFFSAYEIEDVKTYHIQKGDNIWRLCREVFQVPLWLVRKYNASLDFNDLKAAQPVNIPVVGKITPASLIKPPRSPNLCTRPVDIEFCSTSTGRGYSSFQGR